MGVVAAGAVPWALRAWTPRAHVSGASAVDATGVAVTADAVAAATAGAAAVALAAGAAGAPCMRPLWRCQPRVSSRIRKSMLSIARYRLVYNRGLTYRTSEDLRARTG